MLARGLNSVSVKNGCQEKTLTALASRMDRTDVKKRCSTSLIIREMKTRTTMRGFPGSAVVKNLPANAGDMGLSPGPGRSHMLRSN